MLLNSIEVSLTFREAHNIEDQQEDIGDDVKHFGEAGRVFSDLIAV